MMAGMPCLDDLGLNSNLKKDKSGNSGGKPPFLTCSFHEDLKELGT
jgi:hypothetical protein